MNIYEMYFESDYFRGIVDNFVRKHRVSYKSAFKCMEILNAYEAHLNHLTSKARIGCQKY